MVFAFDVLVTGFSMPIFLYAGRNAGSILPFQDAPGRKGNDRPRRTSALTGSR